MVGMVRSFDQLMRYQAFSTPSKRSRKNPFAASVVDAMDRRSSEAVVAEVKTVIAPDDDKGVRGEI
jgi:hypothetical protein